MGYRNLLNKRVVSWIENYCSIRKRVLRSNIDTHCRTVLIGLRQDNPEVLNGCGCLRDQECITRRQVGASLARSEHASHFFHMSQLAFERSNLAWFFFASFEDVLVLDRNSSCRYFLPFG